jgi:hypothetical protein
MRTRTIAGVAFSMIPASAFDGFSEAGRDAIPEEMRHPLSEHLRIRDGSPRYGRRWRLLALNGAFSEGSITEAQMDKQITAQSRNRRYTFLTMIHGESDGALRRLIKKTSADVCAFLFGFYAGAGFIDSTG